MIVNDILTRLLNDTIVDFIINKNYCLIVYGSFQCIQYTDIFSSTYIAIQNKQVILYIFLLEERSKPITLIKVWTPQTVKKGIV